MLCNAIKKLVQYGVEKGITPKCESIYVRNLLLDMYKQLDYDCDEVCIQGNIILEVVLQELLDIAVEKGLIGDNIVEKDLWDAKLMNCLMPRPSQVIDTFENKYKKSPQEATDYYYQLSQDSDYIRTYRVAKDMKWKADTQYGEMDITINLSKPEKDPKAIAAAKGQESSSYPKCFLCMENEGYGGHMNHPGRANHRVIPITINETKWGLQYSPYVYYNEHCIVFSGKHEPMKIEQSTFRKLLDFVKIFPHYFVGSNADLPIVGGSILSHDHFQGGNHTFAMEEAEIAKEITIPGYEDVEAGIVKWPMSVLRIRHEDDSELVELSTHILNKWRGYSDESVEIMAYSGEVPHNTITPIVRKKDGKFEVDLVLRNNRTSQLHPDGIYHPHAHLHHIKKENIGLIEVMGLAVLPARLKGEMQKLGAYLVGEGEMNAEIEKHLAWAQVLQEKYDDINKNNVEEILEVEIGKVFEEVLENAGVFKWDTQGKEAFDRFVKIL